MPLLRLQHIQLAMPAGEEGAARNFYAELLGLGEVPKPENLARRGGCWFEHEEIRVHLGVEQEFRPARKAHPAFEVENLGEFVERLEAAGFLSRQDEPLEGWNRVYVNDPFGNRIELMEPV